MLDFYLLNPLAKLLQRRFTESDFTLRDRLGGGNYGQGARGAASGCLPCARRHAGSCEGAGWWCASREQGLIGASPSLALAPALVPLQCLRG